MKLSEIKGEESLDVLTELLDPATEIMSDPEIARIYKTNQPRIKLVKFILKKHKQSVIEILAIMERKTPEEYKQEMTVLSLPLKLLEVMNDPELSQLFSYQSQNKQETSSGSATENTEANET